MFSLVLIIEDKMAKFKCIVYSFTILGSYNYNYTILENIIVCKNKFCNNKLLKSGEALSSGAIIKTQISTNIEARGSSERSIGI